jgi:hypothetical protein
MAHIKSATGSIVIINIRRAHAAKILAKIPFNVLLVYFIYEKL